MQFLVDNSKVHLKLESRITESYFQLRGRDVFVCNMRKGFFLLTTPDIRRGDNVN